MKSRFLRVLIFMFTFLAVLPVTAGAADAFYRLTHNDHDALILGEVAEVSDKGAKILSKDYIVSAKDLNVNSAIDQQRPESVILQADTKYMYFENGIPKAGDYVLASLDKTADGWKIAWGLYKVDSLDIKTLSVLYAKDASVDSIMEAAALKAFINSGGTVTEFSFDSQAGIVKSGDKTIFDKSKDINANASPSASAAISATPDPAQTPAAASLEPSKAEAVSGDTGTKDLSGIIYGAIVIILIVAAVLIFLIKRRSKRG